MTDSVSVAGAVLAFVVMRAIAYVPNKAVVYILLGATPFMVEVLPAAMRPNIEWRGVPFFAISLLAGLQTISPELNEAAAIDGAKPWNRFWYVTWPLLLPVTMVVLLFSVIQTFADFQLVYVMTGGGPANATQLFATYAYQLGIVSGILSEGAAVSLAMFPFLFIIVVAQLLYIRRVETR